METKVYIHAHWDKWDKKWEYRPYSYAMESKDYLLVDTQMVQFESPTDKQMRLLLAEQLREKKKDILAEAYKEATEVDGEIQQLLALEDHSNDN